MITWLNLPQVHEAARHAANVSRNRLRASIEFNPTFIDVMMEMMLSHVDPDEASAFVKIGNEVEMIALVDLMTDGQRAGEFDAFNVTAAAKLVRDPTGRQHLRTSAAGDSLACRRHGRRDL